MVKLHPFQPAIDGASQAEGNENVGTYYVVPDRVDSVLKGADRGDFPGVQRADNALVFVNNDGFMTARPDTVSAVFSALGMTPRKNILEDTRRIQFGTVRNNEENNKAAARVWRNSTFIGPTSLPNIR